TGTENPMKGFWESSRQKCARRLRRGEAQCRKREFSRRERREWRPKKRSDKKNGENVARGIEHPPRRKRRGFLRPLGLFSRDGFAGFLPQPPYFRGGPRRGFTFGLPAHRSFGQKYRAVRKEKK